MQKAVLYYTIAIIFFLTILGITLVFSLGFVNAGEGMNATMTVEVNLIGFNVSESVEGVGIEVVPDSINLGNITKEDPISDEKRVNITNIGTVNVTVTPMLKNNDKILKYLQFRTRTKYYSDDPERNKFFKIGDYNIFVPFKGSTARREYCYISLNLTDFDGEIDESPYKYNADIVFLAMSK